MWHGPDFSNEQNTNRKRLSLFAAPTVFLGWTLLHSCLVVFDALSLHQASGLAEQIVVRCVLQSPTTFKSQKSKNKKPATSFEAAGEIAKLIRHFTHCPLVPDYDGR